MSLLAVFTVNLQSSILTLSRKWLTILLKLTAIICQNIIKTKKVLAQLEQGLMTIRWSGSLLSICHCFISNKCADFPVASKNFRLFPASVFLTDVLNTQAVDGRCLRNENERNTAVFLNSVNVADDSAFYMQVIFKAYQRILRLIVFLINICTKDFLQNYQLKLKLNIIDVSIHILFQITQNFLFL